MAENIFEIQLESPFSKKWIKKMLLLTEEQKLVPYIFNSGWQNEEVRDKIFVV